MGPFKYTSKTTPLILLRARVERRTGPVQADTLTNSESTSVIWLLAKGPS